MLLAPQATRPSPHPRPVRLTDCKAECTLRADNTSEVPVSSANPEPRPSTRSAPPRSGDPGDRADQQHQAGMRLVATEPDVRGLCRLPRRTATVQHLPRRPLTIPVGATASMQVRALGTVRRSERLASPALMRRGWRNGPQTPRSQALPRGIRHKPRPDIEGIETYLLADATSEPGLGRHKPQPDIEGIETVMTMATMPRIARTSQTPARHRGHRNLSSP